MSYCHHQCPSSVMPCLVVCHKQLGLNVSSDTTRPRALIFGMKHCLVDLYPVYSIGDARVQNGTAARGFRFVNELCLKTFFRTARLRCLKFGI